MITEIMNLLLAYQLKEIEAVVKARFKIPNEHVFTCDVCERQYKYEKSLKNHKRVHTSDVYTCVICDKKFASNSNFTRHMHTHDGEKNLSVGNATSGLKAIMGNFLLYLYIQQHFIFILQKKIRLQKHELMHNVHDTYPFEKSNATSEQNESKQIIQIIITIKYKIEMDENHSWNQANKKAHEMVNEMLKEKQRE
ncbi:hypothetical protein RFI_26741 [Reticulomyxa filosa]|uniref:C2H2-type domain-containing protein n=1 Tax=Reticulomyxa filosa TaxID=46433 RepID=X6MAD8_RETFI|nr:hypothetical protein RFI_26741 [Reticulomyxa filosa]|eukprot:ETO10636.1 hypothetical protein RFI_26741 [Reticulomyxa filosa]